VIHREVTYLSENEALKEIEEAIVHGDKERSSHLVQEALGEIDPLAVIDRGMMPTMEKVGDRFTCGEIFLPEMLMAAEAWDEARGY
jgi:trimethylamine corrinoid protein